MEKSKVKSQKSKVSKEAKSGAIDSGKVASEPATMEELLKSAGANLKVFRRGDVVKGRITAIAGRAVYVDVGGKSEAVISDREYDTAREMIKALKVGDILEAIVAVPESESGQMILSVRRAASDKRWEEMEKLVKSGGTIEVVGKDMTRGGLLVEIDGLIGFVPGSQFGKEWSGRADELVGRKFSVAVLEADRVGNRLVFSERAVSEVEELSRKKLNLSMVRVGEVYDGVVTGVMPFGIFVKIKVVEKEEGGGEESLEGLVHISELSWSKVPDPKALFKEGDGVKVKVIGVEEETGRLALSVKQLQADPWQEMVKKYPVESKVAGKVTRLASFGAFVELPGGIEGLLHISKIPADFPVKPGDEVECFVESVDLEKRRLGLGLVLKAKPLMYK